MFTARFFPFIPDTVMFNMLSIMVPWMEGVLMKRVRLSYIEQEGL